MNHGMNSWVTFVALVVATVTSACGFSCPQGRPVGRYGCVVQCDDFPPETRWRCIMRGADGAIIDDYRPDAANEVGADVVTMDVDAGDVVMPDADAADGSMVIVDPMLVAPRAIAPLSTSTVTSQSPTLRWLNGSMGDGAVVELSRTRDFATVERTERATGDRVRVSSALSAGVWFWRLRSRATNREGTMTSPVWWFRVGARSAPTDTSWGSELDVNGDGYADVAVGSPGADMGRGRVDVFFGGPSGIGSAASLTLRGAAAGELFGISLGSAGDVNGDGFGDLIVGAYEASPGGRTNAGLAIVFHGSSAGVGATPARVLEGVAMGDRFGRSVGTAGDVDGDGFADVIIGAVLASPSGRTNVGSAAVFHGSPGGIGTTAARTLEGIARGDNFGVSVSSAGDVNGDGFADVIVGAVLATPSGRTNAGTATIFHGSGGGVSASPARTLEGVAMGDAFGAAVSRAGDVSGDGFADVVVGAGNASPSGRTNAGTASVFQGSAGGIPLTAARTLEGANAGDGFGRAAASTGG